MKNVVLNEVKDKKEKFEKLLTKICLDFKINNYEEEVRRFINKTGEKS